MRTLIYTAMFWRIREEKDRSTSGSPELLKDSPILESHVTMFDLLLLRLWPSLQTAHHTLLHLIFFTYGTQYEDEKIDKILSSPLIMKMGKVITSDRSKCNGFIKASILMNK